MEKKLPTPKITFINPTTDLIDSWRLFRISAEKDKAEYPSMESASEDQIRSQHYAYLLLNPNFFGVIARIGKKPVGQAFGEFAGRTLGEPNKFFFVFNFWVDPEYRQSETGQAIGMRMWSQLTEAVKARGFHDFEANANEEWAERFKKLGGATAKVLIHRIGGKL